jgi:hypothetical protein
MKKALFVGLGGSGIKTLLGVRDRLWKSFPEEGYEKDRAFKKTYQFVTVDTDRLSTTIEAMKLPENLAEDLKGYHADLGDTVPLTVANNAKKAVLTDDDSQRLVEFVGSQLDNLLAEPLRKGAGAYRINSRLGLWQNYDRVLKLLENALKDLADAGSADLQGTIHAYVFSGLAGGTGSGIVLDVLYLLDRLNDGKKIDVFPILFTPNSFVNYHAANVLLSNGFAAMQEISYFTRTKATNQIKHVAVRFDKPSWAHANLETSRPYKAALVVDSRLQNGTIVRTEDLYPVVADMVAAVLMNCVGQQADSVIDNCVRTANSDGKNDTDFLVSFGCLAIKKPTNYFREYLVSRWKLQVLSAMVGKEGIIKDEDKIEWISKLVESLIGKLFASAGDEERLLKNQALCSDSSAVDCSRGIDKQLIHDLNGNNITNLRQFAHTVFASDDAKSAHAQIGQYYGENFLDEKGKFNAPSDLDGFRANCFEVILSTKIRFEDQTNLLNASAKFKPELKKWLGQSISEKGVIATHELVEAVDAYLDSHCLSNLLQAAEFLTRFRNDLRNQINSVLPDEIKKGKQPAADSLLDQMNLLAASEQYLSLVEAQTNFIKWLCQAERGWLDQEVEYRLQGLRGHLSARLQEVTRHYGTTLPKKFMESAREATTRFLPDIKTYVDGYGRWVDDRDCQFASYYLDLLKDPENSAVSLLNKVNDSASDRADAYASNASYFGDILAEDATGRKLPPEAVVDLVIKAVTKDLEYKLNQQPNSLAGEFLSMQLSKLYADAGETKKNELKRFFSQDNFQYFPVNAPRAQDNALILSGGTKQFAEELVGLTDGHFSHVEPNPDQVVKFIFKGAYGFKDYHYYAGCAGEYEALLENPYNKHNPHIYADFFCQAEVGQNVKKVMDVLAGSSLRFTKGVTLPYTDFERSFATLWLYHVLPKHVSPEVLKLVFKQAFLVDETLYSPFSIGKVNRSVCIGWLQDGRYIQTTNSLIEIPRDKHEDRMRAFKADYLDGYATIKEHASHLQQLLRFFEVKMMESPHRSKLAPSVDEACLVIQKEMSEIANRPDADQEKRTLAMRIAKLCDPDEDESIVHHLKESVLRQG